MKLHDGTEIHITLPIIFSLVGGLATALWFGWIAINWWHDFRDEMKNKFETHDRSIEGINKTLETIKSEHSAFSVMVYNVRQAEERIDWLEGYKIDLGQFRYEFGDLKTQNENNIILHKTETTHLLREYELAFKNEMGNLQREIEELKYDLSQFRGDINKKSRIAPVDSRMGIQ